MDTTTQFLSILVILLVFVLFGASVGVMRRQRNRLALRVIPAYEHVPQMVGAAIEANRPMHLSMGSTGIGNGNTVLSLATAELFYQTARQAAISASSPILTTSNPTSIPLEQDILRRAYASRYLLQRFRSSDVQWYPSGPRSLAFAAALTALVADNHVGGNVLVGSFGSELALILDATYRRGQMSIAASDRLDGQAIAYAMADEPLIGEEIYVAGAYLDDQRVSVFTLDVLRWVVILAIVALAIITAFGGR
ncbi:MAG: hypothetical protein K8L99_08985 [Anaerolineae bacterium]|nr:hypothetical protein [Anaerolineae bacterium]